MNFIGVLLCRYVGAGAAFSTSACNYLYLRGMRHARALVLMLAAGCYVQPVGTHYALEPREQCAQNASVLDNGGPYGAPPAQDPGGLYGATTTQAPGENGGLYGAAMRNSEQPVLCRRPASPADACEVRAMQASAQLKHQSNVGEVAPVSNDQIEYVRSSTYQSCMGPPQ
jgi:hypothetical protein